MPGGCRIQAAGLLDCMGGIFRVFAGKCACSIRAICRRAVSNRKQKTSKVIRNVAAEASRVPAQGGSELREPFRETSETSSGQG